MAEEELKIDLEESDENEPTEIEIEAASHGWNPEGADGKRNLTAEEFMDRQPLYDDNRSLKKHVKKLQEGYDALTAHHSKVAAHERAKVMEELKMAKKEALENENFDAVIQIDEKIADTRAEEYAENITPATNSNFENWVEDNPWYNQDSTMKEYADMIGNGYASQNPKKNLEEVYEYVSKEVKGKFPDKFQNPLHDTSSPVEPGQRGGRRGSRKLRAADLPEEDRHMMRQIIRAGGITEEQYLKEYAELDS